jgi:hypothetical protein
VTLRTSASFDLARILGIAPAQILKEVVFFRFNPHKRYAPHALHLGRARDLKAGARWYAMNRKRPYKNGEYDLVLVLVNGDRMVDERLLKQFLFGEEYQEEDARSLVATASREAIFHRTGFTAPFVPPLFHRYFSCSACVRACGAYRCMGMVNTVLQQEAAADHRGPRAGTKRGAVPPRLH